MNCNELIAILLSYNHEIAIHHSIYTLGMPYISTGIYLYTYVYIALINM